MTNPSQIRISDSDRQAAADRLRVAQSEGRLTVADYDNRLGSLYQAVTYGDIAILFVDLPSPVPQQMPMPQQPFMGAPQPQFQPQFQPQPLTGPIAGPAAVVQNTIVVSGPNILPNSGLAVAGMIFGIIALLGFWIPFGDIAFSGLAVLLSILGFVQVNKGQHGGRGMAITGLVCGIIGLIPAIIVVSLLFSAAASVH
jgi:hypothetical protein